LALEVLATASQVDVGGMVLILFFQYTSTGGGGGGNNHGVLQQVLAEVQAVGVRQMVQVMVLVALLLHLAKGFAGGLVLLRVILLAAEVVVLVLLA
jgi:hypothetical protein